MKNRYAAIDIGTNGVRLLLASMSGSGAPGDLRKDSLVRVPIRLGEDVFSSGKISEEKFTDLVNAMQGFSYLIKAYRPQSFRAVATSAMREASNASEIIRKIRRKSGIGIEVLSGPEEARTIYSAHLQQNLPGNSDYLYIDVGGGSTEIIIFQDKLIVDFRSFDIGTVRSLQGYGDKEGFQAIKGWLQSNPPSKGKFTAVGTGGNINRALKILGKKSQNKLSASELENFYKKLKSISPEKRMEKFGLKSDRADVIVPALKIYLTILKGLSLKSITIPNIGLIDGLIYDMINSGRQK